MYIQVELQWIKPCVEKMAQVLVSLRLTCCRVHMADYVAQNSPGAQRAMASI